MIAADNTDVDEYLRRLDRSGAINGVVRAKTRTVASNEAVSHLIDKGFTIMETTMERMVKSSNESEYAIVITDKKGEKKVCTRSFGNKPFKSATAAAIQSAKFQDLFPLYTYEVMPVMPVPTRIDAAKSLMS